MSLVGVSQVTAKFQVTIPKAIREKMGLKPGEKVIIEAREGEIVIRRFRTLKDPLKVLIGTKQRFDKPVPIEELEERVER